MWLQALKLYDEMLETNSANMLAMKRRVAVYKAQGKMTSTIRALTELLQTFQTDVESWKELVTLYMASGDMKKALYCQEEVVLADPHNYQNHNRYADLLYTLGGANYLRSARRHFAQSLELSPENNLRAAYGLSLSSYSLSILSSTKQQGGTRSSSGKNAKQGKTDDVSSDEDELNKKLFDKSVELLGTNYKGSSLLKQVESMSQKLQKTFGQNDKMLERVGKSSSRSGTCVGGGASKEGAKVGDID
jgi:tetratricopeptide (TPR) repeat protein